MHNEISFHLDLEKFPLDGISIGDVYEFVIEGTVEKAGIEDHYSMMEKGKEKKCFMLQVKPKKIEHSLLENQKMREMIRDNG